MSDHAEKMDAMIAHTTKERAKRQRRENIGTAIVAVMILALAATAFYAVRKAGVPPIVCGEERKTK